MGPVFEVHACATRSAQPKKPVDVQFGRNYVPTWAFDHIKYSNGGAEAQLILDKYTVNAKFCATQGKRWWDQKAFQDLDAAQYKRLKWVRQKYTIYNYCTDHVRFPTTPVECKRDRDI
ncbi:hypothetical protein EZV62_020242 [Acer yangbiense]|uniref:Xyloglucan endo-transglycosylase C-terminal domain-containing protein n=1 Tax=Acer yangbiense TaxID=1000413 RepID=A0A5C7HFM2_9ROSI|nr:hypothetical protein EZV62_020242 [Acer yangbiense]